MRADAIPSPGGASTKAGRGADERRGARMLSFTRCAATRTRWASRRAHAQRVILVARAAQNCACAENRCCRLCNKLTDARRAATHMLRVIIYIALYSAAAAPCASAYPKGASTRPSVVISNSPPARFACRSARRSTPGRPPSGPAARRRRTAGLSLVPPTFA